MRQVPKSSREEDKKMKRLNLLNMMAVAVVVELLALGFSTMHILQVYGQSSRLYAGYVYLGYEGNPPAYGVSATIFTIDKNVLTRHLYAQWPSVVLRYRPLNRIQVGYTKGWDTNYTLVFYVEKNDTNGHLLEFIPGVRPSPPYTYVYWIIKNTATGGWTAGADAQNNLFTWDFGVLNPNDAKDYQAFSKTSTGSINIDGTHFMSLSVKYETYWLYWGRHEPYWDYPYSLYEISHYEFIAWGGG
ncbi:MAG: hypothetical protein QW057_02470 [Candidatus Bathyarchaeia archaeon]